MPARRLTRVLQELGLGEPEAQVYLAALALGPSGAAPIANAAGIKRTTVYTVLERLQARGLVAQELRGLKRVFAAANPEVLTTVLTSRAALLGETLPEFLALFNQKGASGIIKYFEGTEAALAVYERLIRTARPGEPYLVLSDMAKTLGLYPEFFPDFIKRRAKLQLKPRNISADNADARRYAADLLRVGSPTKFLSKQISISINMVIIPRMVVIHQVVPPVYAVLLESPVVAEALRQLFEIIWQTIPDSRG